MDNRIRFESAKPFWIELAQLLDLPYVTRFDNWEAVAENLDFKLNEIKHIKCLRHESGSNTIIMFEKYIQRTDGGDLDQVMDVLRKIRRLDVLDILQKKYERIKERNKREYGPESMFIPAPQERPTPGQYHPQPSQQWDYSGRTAMPGYPAASHHNQVVYVPTDKQRQNLPHHLLQRLVPDQNGAPPMAWQTPTTFQQYQTHHQKEPINLKKPCAYPKPLSGARGAFPFLNKRTDEDFVPGFGRQLRNSLDANDSMEPQYQQDSLLNRNDSWIQQSLHQPCQVDRPAEFTEVLMRGQGNLASLSQPMLEALEQSNVPKCFAAHSPRQIDMSGVEASQNCEIVIKREEAVSISPMDTSAPPSITAIQQPVHQLRDTVIHVGPQCNSLPTVSPGDPSQTEFPAQDKEEVEEEHQIRSCPEFPSEKVKASPKRYTWPLSSQDLKQRKDELSHLRKEPFPKRFSFSVDKNYRQNPFEGKNPIKVLITYTLNGNSSRSNKKELIVLYNCLKKNGFLPSLDLAEIKEFSRDMYQWMDTKFQQADFVLVCITPQYKIDVDHSGGDHSTRAQNTQARCCRYIYRMMQNEFVNLNSRNTRFRPVLFPGASNNDIPMWMQSTVPFRWREDWQNILYMMLEPESIMKNIKQNTERFANIRPVIKMTTMCM